MGENRIASYKSLGGDDEEALRTKRSEAVVSLRKEKRHKLLAERRHIDGTGAETMEEEPGPITDINVAIQEISINILQTENAIKLRGLQLANLLATQEPKAFMEHFSSMDMIGKCVQFLQMKDNPDIQYEAVSVVAKIAHVKPNSVMKWAAYIIPPLIETLGSSSPQLVALSCREVGKIFDYSRLIRNEMIEKGLLPALVNVRNLHSENIDVMRPLSWAFSRIFAANYILPQSASSIASQCLPTLAKLIFINNSEVLGNACQTFSYLCDSYYGLILDVVNAGVVPRLIDVLNCEDPCIVSSCLHAIYKILSGIDCRNVKILVEIAEGVVPKLMNLLQSQNDIIVEKGAWLLSRISAGDLRQIAVIMDTSGAIPLLFDTVEKGNTSAQRDALLVLKNITKKGFSSHIIDLCGVGLTPLMCRCLKTKSWSIVFTALEIVENILKAALPNPNTQFLSSLEEGGGLERIDQLASCENDYVARLANWIVEYYFDGVTDIDDENVSLDLTADKFEMEVQDQDPDEGFPL